MQIVVEKITPSKAREWLKSNPDNRNVRPTRVSAYARDMERNAWMENGSAICFTEDGELVDGQHRLLACIEAGSPFKSIVARGVEPKAKATIDAGAARCFADTLKFMGYKNVSQLAASIRWGWMYDSQCLTKRTPATHTDLLQWMSENINIVGSVDRIKHYRTPFRAVHTIMSVIHAKTELKLPGQAMAFHVQMSEGSGLESGSPILELRRLLEFNALGPRKMPVLVQQAIIVKAWNAWIEGREVSRLTFVPGGTKAEVFPEIVTEVAGS